jgi:DNA-binding NarL/FixJ family response regulator
MAATPLTARLVLDDFERAEAISAALAELGVGTADGGETAVIVTDGERLDDRTPHVLIGASASDAHGATAALPATAQPRTVAAAALLAAQGFSVARAAAVSRANGHEPGIAGLSARESEVLALLAEGAPNKVIARRLDISVHTAKFHVAAIIAKLGAANRTEAIGIAMREGLVLV